MAIPGGPNIITNGLVTYFDVANVDSFRGEPTTNLALNPEFTSTSNWSVATNGGGSLSVSGGFGKIVMGTPGSFNFLNQSRTISIPPNTVCTWSAYFKNNRVGNFAIRLILFDGASVPAQPQTTVVLDGSGGLKRYSVSASYSGTTTSVRLDILSGSFYSGLSNSDVEFTKCQFELKPYMTEFVNGTRGTTVATGGGVADISNNNNNGELVNGTTFNSLNLGNIIFDGTDDYINVSNSETLNFTNQATISIWIYPFSVTQGNFAGLVAKNTGGGTNRQSYTLSWRQVSNALWAQICDGNSTYNTISAPLPTIANVWYNIVFTWSGSQLVLYNNGVVIGTLTQTINCQILTTSLTIGGFTYKGSGGAGEPFNGRIANMQLYNRALTADEILQNYNSTKSRFGIT